MLDLETVKSYLMLVDDSQDGFLATEILLITDAINTYCERSLDSKVLVVNFFNKEPTKEINLYEFPVTQVDSLTVDGVDQVFSFFNTGKIISKNKFPSGSIEISFVAGYTEEDMPPVLKNVFLNIIKKRYQRYIDNEDVDDIEDFSSVSIVGVATMKYNTRKADDINIYLEGYQGILDRYKSARVF